MSQARYLDLAALLLCCAGLAQAAGMVDPTRPPAQMLAPSPEQVAVVAVVGPQLQMILLASGAGGRKVAVIDGQALREGEQFKGAELLSVTANEVVLGRGKTQLVLKLSPKLKPSSGDADNVKEQ